MQAYTIIDAVATPSTLALGLHTRAQQILPGMRGDESAQTSLQPVGKTESGKFLRFLVTHEDYTDINGRWNGQQVDHLIQKFEFPVYRQLPDGPFLVTRKKLWRSAYSRLHRDNPDFNLRPKKVDLLKIAKNVHASGGYFSELELVDVDSASIFGERVVESSEWNKYEALGKIKAIIFKIPGISLGKMMLTEDATVLLYSQEPTDDALEAVLEADRLIGMLEAYVKYDASPEDVPIEDVARILAIEGAKSEQRQDK